MCTVALLEIRAGLLILMESTCMEMLRHVTFTGAS